jgi:two-component system phosphate regulon response regulator PhoB
MFQSAGRLLVIVQDDLLLLLRHILECDGYQTIVAITVEAALDLARLQAIDLVILDETLLAAPGDPASCYCEFIKQWSAPLLILGADCRVGSHAVHMSPGRTIDVMPKPVSPQELLRRVGIFLRSEGADAMQATLAFAGIELNARTQRIYRNGRRIAVTPLEFRLLHHLMTSPGEVFSREAILRAAWPSDVFVGPRTVDVHMGKLRKSLNGHGEPNLIRTVRSRGYALDLED